MRLQITIITGLCFGLLICCQRTESSLPEPSQGLKEGAVSLDSLTGLVMAEHFELVKAHCTACHSGKLVVQNRASREGWEQMIRRMQAEQGLWDLGENETLILDYLALHYGPQAKGRRVPLTNIEWYQLEE